MKLVRAVLLLFIVSSIAAADQPLRFGQPFPLTNTSYGSAYGEPKLVAAGDELYAFWATQTDVRMTRIAREQRAGIPLIALVAPATQLDPVAPAWRGKPLPFDVVWTGSHFLLAAEQPRMGIVTQLFNRAGEPVSPRIQVMDDAWGPKLAINGDTALLTDFAGRLTILTKDGQVAASGGKIGSSIAALIPYGSGFAAAVSDTSAAYVKTFDGAGRPESTTHVADGFATGMAANDDGLLVCVSQRTSLLARFLHRDGTAEPLLTLADTAGTNTRFYSAAPAWSGAEWIVTYDEAHVLPTTETFHVAALDRRATRVIRSVSRPGSKFGGVPFRFADRTYVSWYPGQQLPLPAPLFAEVSAALETAEPWTFKAGEQQLLATTASDDATLVVWKEEINGEARVRTGIRSRGGEWSESTIAVAGFNDSAAVAASDGQNFLVVLGSRHMNTGGARVFRLDARGRAAGAEIRLESQVTGAVWNGKQWVLVSATYGKLSGFFVPANGTVVETKTIELPRNWQLHDATIAFDGTGYAVAWAVGAECWILPCRGALGIRATRLTAGFERRDAEDFTLAIEDSFVQFDGPSIVWDGSEYLVAWGDAIEETIAAVTLPRSGGAPSAVFPLASDVGWVPNGLRVAGREIAVVGARYPNAGVVFLHDRARGITRTRTFDHGTTLLRGFPRIEVLPDDRIAYFVSRTSPFAPQHGATHVMMSIQEPVAAPGAPELTVRPGSGSAHLTWNAAPGVVNGYRVEYRLNDGSWNELTQWFDADERSHVFRLPATATTAFFRVRAWSDGGTGPYSDEVAPTEEPPAPPTGKRRSVR